MILPCSGHICASLVLQTTGDVVSVGWPCDSNATKQWGNQTMSVPTLMATGEPLASDTQTLPLVWFPHHLVALKSHGRLTLMTSPVV